MDDFIDRKELLRAIKYFNFNICCARATDKYKTSRMQYEMYTAIREQFLLIAEGMPKADTRRHAHWIRINDVLSQCSNCKTTILTCDTDNYCSYCGCRMDEVVGNE